MILVLDNRDSFVFNLARYVELLGVETAVHSSHALDVAAIARLTYERDEWREADRAECAENARLRARMADMQGERDAAELSRDAAHARLAEAERTIARLSGFTP